MLDGPEVDVQLFRALKALGVAGTNVAGTAPSTQHGANEIPFYVDHTAGKGTLALRPEVWTEKRETWLKSGDAMPPMRPNCLDDPVALDRMRRRILEVTSAAAPNRPAAYALDDEISQTSHESPFDFCWCPETLAKVRAFALSKYGSLEAAARTWGVRADKIEDLLPLSTQAVRRREFIVDPMRWNFSSWSDHRELMDRSMTESLRALAAEVRKADPGARVGFTGVGAPSPFSGVIWSDVLPFLDFVEPYDIGGSRELVRSFARPDTAITRTLFRDKVDDRFNIHELWDYMLRGDRGVIIWSAKTWFDGRNAQRPTAWARALAPTLRALGGDAAARFLAARERRPEIAVLESPPSNRMHWMLDSREDGRTWINRLASYEETHSSQNRVREGWQKLLEDLHHDYRHISPAELTAEGLRPFKVLILPRAIALSKAQAKAIETFGEKRTVIADCQTALFDENLTVHAQSPLDEAFGIRRDNRIVYLSETAYTGPVDVRHGDLKPAEPGITVVPGVPTHVRVGDIPALIVRSLPSGGRFIYLNLLLTDYAASRLERVEENALLLEMRGLLRAAGVTTLAEVRFPNEDPLPVRFFVREHGAKTYLALVANFRTSSTPMNHASVLARKDPKIEILLHRSGAIRDLLTGDAVAPMRDGRPARVSSFETTLPIFEPRIFEIEYAP